MRCNPLVRFILKGLQRMPKRENVKIWVPSIANNSSILAFETGLSILHQIPFSLLKSAMWLSGYSRLKKVGLSGFRCTFLAARTCKDPARHPDYNRARQSAALSHRAYIIIWASSVCQQKSLPERRSLCQLNATEV
eukprot:sb/3474601/